MIVSPHRDGGVMETTPGEEKLSVALDAGGMGWWELDIPTLTLDASPNCKANYGRSPGEPFTYDMLLGQIHPDDVARILAKEYADEWAGKIRMDRMLDLPKVSPPMNPSTIYVTVVDKDRNVCSFINSVAHSWGSAIVSNKTGVLYQNRGAGFRIEPGHPNCIAPGKRPLHTTIPALATKGGRAVMPFGVMGGQYQPVGQTRVLTNMLDYGCDVQEAIDMPRGLHYEGVYQLEDSVPADIVAGLQKLGHQTTKIIPPLGGGQAIWIDWEKGTLTGGSDPRKDGCALGY